MFGQPCAVLIFNNNALVILTAMAEKKDGECIKRAFVTHENNNKARLTPVTAIAGITIISALLLSGLSLISSHLQPVLAQQQNITNGDGAAGGDATTIGNTTSTTGSTAQGGNATGSAAGAGGNQSELRMHLEEARSA